MPKVSFVDARLVDVTTVTKDGFTNSHIHICELGRSRPVIASIKIKPEDASKFQPLEGKIIPELVANSYDKSGVSKAGKPYAFTEYSFESITPPAKAA